MQVNKLLLIGDANSGKTAFYHALQGEFNDHYIPTLGVEVHLFGYNKGRKFKIWDIGWTGSHEELRYGYYIGGECCLIFYDSTLGYDDVRENIDRWIREIRSSCHDIPIVVVFSKRDLVSNDCIAELFAGIHDLDVQGMVSISNRSTQDIRNPLDILDRMLEWK